MKRFPSTNAMCLLITVAVLATVLGEPMGRWVWTLLGGGLLIAVFADLLRQEIER